MSTRPATPIGACCFHFSLTVTVHQPVGVTSGQPSRMTSLRLMSVSKLSVLPFPSLQPSFPYIILVVDTSQ